MKKLPTNFPNNTTMSKKKITYAMVVQWIGEDNIDDLAETILAIANGEYKPADLKEDIDGTCSE